MAVTGFVRRGEIGEHRGMRVVGWDVVGGFLAADAEGRVHHLAADAVLWEDLELDVDELDDWLASDDADAFWEGEVWPGWPDDVADLGAAEVWDVDPPAWSRKPGEIPARSALGVGEAWRRACVNLERLG
jgi:hypothetical protein